MYSFLIFHADRNYKWRLKIVMKVDYVSVGSFTKDVKICERSVKFKPLSGLFQ